MQRRFPSFRIYKVRVGAVLQQKLAQLPMAMETRSIQPAVASQRRKCGSLRKQMLYGAYIAVIGTPFHKRDTVGVSEGCEVALGQEFKDKVGATFNDFIEQAHDRAL